LEENNYYPFGLKHQGYNDIANSCRSEVAEKYQYNGKEWNDALGLNIYEMDLRQYDPAIGRWTVQDPVIHHEFSPYSAFDNNPVYWADPSGADAVPVSVMDLFNAAEGDITTFTFVNGSLIGTETYMVEELLQNLYEMQPLEGPEYEGSKGNAYGGGNGGGDPKGKYKNYSEWFQRVLQHKFLNNFTFEDAIYHYNFGEGESVTVNINTLNFDGITVERFLKSKEFHEGYRKIAVNFL